MFAAASLTFTVPDIVQQQVEYERLWLAKATEEGESEHDMDKEQSEQ